MPLDPITSLGLAGNVIQCVDFLCTMLENAKQIYESSAGVNLESEHLEKIASLMTDISVKIRDFDASTPTEQTDVEAAAEACNVVAKELNKTIQRIKPKDKHKALSSLWSAVRSAWRESRIENIKGKLDDHRRILMVQLLARIL